MKLPKSSHLIGIPIREGDCSTREVAQLGMICRHLLPGDRADSIAPRSGIIRLAERQVVTPTAFRRS